MSIEIKRSDKYVDYNISAANNRGYITIDTSDWINKPWMFYELPSLKFEIYTETDGELVKYQNFSREIRTYNPVYSPLGVLNVTIDIRNVPEEFILRITPIFDNDAVAARNMLVENGIEDGDIWGSDQGVPTQLFNLNLEFIECVGEYVPPTPPVPPTHEETITGIPHITFDGSTGEPLVSWTILGNSYQSGTPTPNNIIMPEFVGVKYENLFDKTGEIYPWNEAELTFSGNTIRATVQTVRTQCYAAILLSNTQQLLGKTLTLSATITQSTPTNTGGLRVFWYNGNYPALAVYQDQPETGYATATFTVPDTIPDGMQCLCILFTANWYGTCEIGDYVDYENVILNEGDSAEPFVPYGESGWKIPISCGGENLFDRTGEISPYFINESGEISPISSGLWYVSDFTPVQPNTTYTFTYNSLPGTAGYHAFYDANKELISTLSMSTYTFTTPNNARYMRFSYRGESYDIMLNLGSTSKPYAPYSRQTNTVYLGQTQTVRKIKKLVLTGTESTWSTYTVQDSSYCAFLPIQNFMGATTSAVPAMLICTHYLTSSQNNIFNGTYKTGCGGRTNQGLLIRDQNITSETDFKSFLATQYANGTPVTVWYVLAESTTGIVNEPLCKISDYSDELSSTNSGVTIQTVDGDNVLTVDTDLQPSEVTITYMKEGQ